MKKWGAIFLAFLALFLFGCSVNPLDIRDDFIPSEVGVSDWHYSFVQIGVAERVYQRAEICFNGSGHPYVFLFASNTVNDCYYWDGGAWHTLPITSVPESASNLYYSAERNQIETVYNNRRYTIIPQNGYFESQGAPSSTSILHKGNTSEGYIHYLYLEKTQQLVEGTMKTAFRPREAIYNGAIQILDRLIDPEYSIIAETFLYGSYIRGHITNVSGDHSIAYYLHYVDAADHWNVQVRRAEYHNGVWTRRIIVTSAIPKGQSLPSFNTRVVWDQHNSREYFYWNDSLYVYDALIETYATSLPFAITLTGAINGVLYTSDGAHFSPSYGYDRLNMMRTQKKTLGNVAYNKKIYSVGTNGNELLFEIYDPFKQPYQ